jgi:3-phenylpropionate/trans-cinnamate dioxygenase ferredoxin component
MREITHPKIPDSSSAVLEAGGRSILLCNSGGTHYAIENRCTHQESPLAGGRVRNGFISCPLHGVRFNLKTGEPIGDLARLRVKTFAVIETDDGIVVALD